MLSMDQATWRSEFERRHNFGIAVLPTPTRPTEDIMARTIKLPARANSLVYDDETVLDIYLSLLGAGDGEGVVIDDNLDTEPKARVRCRTMAKALAAGLSVEDSALSDDDKALADAYIDTTKSDSDTVVLDGIIARSHVVAVGENEYAPVLSLKR